MFWFLLLIIVHHPILTIKKNNFFVLGKGTTDDINDSTGVVETKI